MLEKKIYIRTGSTTSAKDMGNNIPPYFPNFRISEWYNGSESFFYNLVNDEQVFIQYGKDAQGWASAKFFSQTVEVINETEGNNGIIDADLKIIPKYFKGYKNSFSVSGYQVQYRIYIGTKLIYSFNGETTDTINFGEQEPIFKHITVKPQENNTESAYRLNIHYPNGEFTDADLYVGIGLFNPNPKTYIPMAIRKGGIWKDLNSNKGKILKRTNDSWKDFSFENIDTIRQINKGHNRLRKQENWRQLPPMKGGNV